MENESGYARYYEIFGETTLKHFKAIVIANTNHLSVITKQLSSVMAIIGSAVLVFKLVNNNEKKFKKINDF